MDLLLTKANVYLANMNGDTPLHVAIYSHQWENVLKLLPFYSEATPLGFKNRTRRFFLVSQMSALLALLIATNKCVQKNVFKIPRYPHYKSQHGHPVFPYWLFGKIDKIFMEKETLQLDYFSKSRRYFEQIIPGLAKDSFHIADDDGICPLHIAVLCENSEFITTLLRKNDWNVTDKDGNTPFHYVCYRESKHRSGTNQTLENFAKSFGRKIKLVADKKNNSGKTAFHMLFDENPARAIHFLEFSSNLNIPDEFDNQNGLMHKLVLSFGSLEESRKLVHAIVAFGGDLNGKNRNGMTPLHLAFCRGSFSIAEELILAGADFTTKDNAGKTPVQYLFSVVIDVMNRFELEKCVSILVDKGCEFDDHTKFHLKSVVKQKQFSFVATVNK
jgi:ankyrin repeat protein